MADECPYPGLAAFTEAEAKWFFGRERLTAELTRRVAACYDDPTPLLVVGASGSGKSSLLRAGLLPAIARGDLGIAGSVAWRTLFLTPSATPLDNLGACLASLVGAPAEETVQRLRGDQADVTALWQEALAAQRVNDAGTGRLVMVVDQFEEIFTACADREQRRLFVRALHAATGGARGGAAALVVLGMRADFVGRCADHVELAQALARPVVIGPMTASEVRSTIERPAAAVGLTMEPGLTDLLLNDLGVHPDGGPDGEDGQAYEAGRLPLLSHAMRATWQRRDGDVLTVASYGETGGIRGALAATADRVMAGLDEPTRKLARPVLLRLVQIGESAEDTRRRVPHDRLLAELPHRDRVDVVLNAFAADDARLITTDEDTVEITHEALLHAWPTLRSWIDADRAGLLVEQHLINAAHAWDQDGRDPGGLYRGSRLALTRDWAAESGRRETLGVLALAFLDASLDSEASELRVARRRNRLRTVTIAALAVLLVGSVALGGVTESLRRTADAQREAADTRRDTAVASNLAARATELRESDPVTAMRLSLAAWRVSANDDTRSALFGSLTQREVSVFGPPSVDEVGYSGDGTAEAVLTGDDVQIWDVTTHRQRLTLPKVGRGAFHIALSHNGRLLALEHEDGFSDLWDTLTGRRLKASLRGTARFTPVDDLVVLSSPDGEEVLYHVPDSRPVPGLPAAARIDLNRAGDLAAVATTRGYVELYRLGPRTVRIARLGLGRKGGSDPSVDVNELRISPDGRWILAGGWDAVLLDLARKDGRPRYGRPATGADERDVIRHADFSADGTVLATANDWSVQLWNTATMTEMHRFVYPGFAVEALKFVAGDDMIVLGGADGTVRTVDVRAFTHPLALRAAGGEPNGPVAGALLSPDGETMATLARSVVRFWSRRTGEQLGADLKGPWSLWWDRMQSTKVAVPAMAFTPDGRTLAAVRSRDVVSLIDVPHTRERARIPLSLAGEGVVLTLAFSPDGRTLAISDTVSGVRLWDVGRLRQVMAAKQSGLVTTVVWSPGGRVLALSHPDRTWLWEPASGAATGKPFAREHSSEALAFSPDGRTLVVRGENDCTCANQIGPAVDGRVWMRDVTTGLPINPPLAGHAEPAVAVSFSPDGAMLATAGADNTVRLWNTTTHRAIGIPLTGHTGDVVAVGFSADSRTLFTVGAEGGVQHFALDPGVMTRAVCARAGGGLSEQDWRRLVPADVEYRRTC